jgi:hypothetical protein
MRQGAYTSSLGSERAIKAEREASNKQQNRYQGLK